MSERAWRRSRWTAVLLLSALGACSGDDASGSGAGAGSDPFGNATGVAGDDQNSSGGVQ